MFRIVARAILGLATMALAGCKDRYKDAIDQQVANWKEVAGILREVKDPQTMEAAEGKLLARVARFQDAARKASALPKPDEATLQRIDRERPVMQSALDEMKKELDRVKKLPNGAVFFERIEDFLPGASQGSFR